MIYSVTTALNRMLYKADNKQDALRQFRQHPHWGNLPVIDVNEATIYRPISCPPAKIDANAPIELRWTNRRDCHKLINTLGFQVGVELGVQAGAFSEELVLHTKIRQLFGVDSWATSESNLFFREALTRMSHQKTRYEMVVADTTIAADVFPDEYFDFIFVDAEHDYKHCAQDIQNWWPKAKNGALFFGHDYNYDSNAYRAGVMKIEKVMQAADEFAVQKGQDMRVVGTPSLNIDEKHRWANVGNIRETGQTWDCRDEIEKKTWIHTDGALCWWCLKNIRIPESGETTRLNDLKFDFNLLNACDWCQNIQ